MGCGCGGSLGDFKSGQQRDDDIEVSQFVPYNPLEEPVDCYMARAGNTAGNVAPQLPDTNVDKLTTINIVADCSMNLTQAITTTTLSQTVNFKLLTLTNTALTLPGITFNTATGTFSGQFLPSAEGQTFQFFIVMYSSSNVELDRRQYQIKPGNCKQGSTITFIHPLPGAIVTSKFGPRVSPTPGASSVHGGVDLAYTDHHLGDVIASADGVVAKAGPGTGYGNVIYLDHKDGNGNLVAQTRYAHLTGFYVSEGQKVSQGQKIGKEGNTGIGTAAHTHFEIRLNGKPVDPLQYINGTAKIAGDGSGTTDAPAGNGQITTVTNTNKGVTAAESTSCSTPTYANTPSAPATSLPGVVPVTSNISAAQANASAFDLAVFYYFVNNEIGPWFTWTQYTTAAGHINGTDNRLCGRHGWNDARGGDTKYGIAKKWNPSLNMDTLAQSDARAVLQGIYWTPVQLNTIVDKGCAIAMFNCAAGPEGPNAYKKITIQTVVRCGGTATTYAQALSVINQMTTAQKTQFIQYFAQQRQAYLSAKGGLAGWVTRINGCTSAALQYVS